MTKREYKQKRKTQIMFGLFFLAISALIVIIACTGSTTETKDATAVLLTAPLGLYLIGTKHIIIM